MDDADAQLELIASWVDEAAQARSSHAAQRSLGARIPISEHEGPFSAEDSTAASRKAAGWAFSYQVQVAEKEGKWRAQINPYFEGPDGSARPPYVDKVPDACVNVWSALAESVSSSYGKARLHHLLFERRFGNARSHAIQAARAYLQLSHEWAECLDKEEALNLSLRMARAVGEVTLANQVMNEMLDLINRTISGDFDAPGVALRLLRPLVSERSVPEGVQTALDGAMQAYDSPFIRDEILTLRMGRADKSEDREALEERRVQIWLDAADKATGLAKSGHLKTALRRAESSGKPDLIGRAASALQKIREEDLGLASFSASSAMSRETFQEYMKPVTSAPGWREALIQFVGAYGPAVGTVERTIKAVDEYAKHSLVEQLATTELLGADGLPRFSPQNDAEKREMQLARQESFMLQTTAPLLAHALHKISEFHGTPSEEDLAEFFSQGPLAESELAASIARCFIRYWTGDPEGAAFSAAPKIEALARNLVIGLDAGVYRLQRNDKPGQYPGLGTLLGVLREKGLDESWYRNILTICGNPAGGWNLRNDLAHGFIDNAGSPPAALLLQSVVYLWALGPKVQADEAEAAGAQDHG
ncbi:DUF4209 domain-containing protein [Streptomyces sp. NPDC088358]|uniref:DUF4209 domain-containing protein n=1 Tax=Streptomyces sp. NPDC088358 TaxID=3365857 RepID=UPI0038182E97